MTNTRVSANGVQQQWIVMATMEDGTEVPFGPYKARYRADQIFTALNDGVIDVRVLQLVTGPLARAYLADLVRP